MRVLMVITKGELGGAQTHVLELCRALADTCEFLVLIGGSARSALGDELECAGIRVQHVATISNSISPRAVLRSVRMVHRAIAQWRPEALHLHSAAAGVVGRIAGGLTGVPVVYTVHGFGFKPGVPAMRRTLAYLVELALGRLTRRLICVSEYEGRLARKLRIPPHRVAVVFNGIADTHLRAAPGESPPVLIMVARMAPPKRHDLMLEALAILRNRGLPLPRAVLAGGGPQMQTLQAAVCRLDLPGIEMQGDVLDVPALLARSHVFVLLSDHEGQPISVIEAMRAGLPIVASDLPGIRSQMDHGCEGLFTRNDATGVADALEVLLSDTSLRHRMGQAARDRYEKEFHVRKMAGRVAAIYQDATCPNPAALKGS